MHAVTRKTAATVSGAVREFMSENGVQLDSINASLVQEKVFTDKKEYTVELSSRTRPTVQAAAKAPAEDGGEVEFARASLQKMLSLSGFSGINIAVIPENGSYILKISAGAKDGLIIGKNGQNLFALQYLITLALEKKYRRHPQIIIDIDSYREKRASFLRSSARAMAEKAVSENTEIITELLPSYERKLIHEEISSIPDVSTFSIGKGPYKKVVITSLL
ncbi:MAG TPA: R3H domain-containing nucleic acid-binding protein [Candidatus Goldiibacteriota bacterium]|nr:R3H domain-containing nucleic acid-binding protein [Candidatus Goldiibacteriota bacterium]